MHYDDEPIVHAEDTVKAHLLQGERQQSALRVHYDDEPIVHAHKNSKNVKAHRSHLCNGKLHVHYDDETVDKNTPLTSSSEYNKDNTGGG